MIFTQTATVESSTDGRSATGAIVPAWSPVAELTDIPARIIPMTTEEHERDMTVVEDAYEILLATAASATEVTAAMRVVDGSDAYDIRRVLPLPLGMPGGATIVHAVKTEPS